MRKMPDETTVSEQRAPRTAETPAASPPPAAAAAEPAVLKPRKRGLRRWRTPLLLAAPILAIVAAAGYWVTHGRFVSVDNAYVGAETVMIAPQVTGAIQDVAVKEGQAVKAGDLLFRIDPEPYRIALDTARGQQAAAELQWKTAIAKYKKSLTDVDNAKAQLEYAQRNFDRIEDLAKSRVSSTADLDRARLSLDSAKAGLASAQAGAVEALAALNGKADLPLSDFPPYVQATAAIESAERNLRLTEVTAPFNGTASQTTQVVKGRILQAGAATLAVVSTDTAWVDANPKETELGAVQPGQPVEVYVDAYPDHVFRGRVLSLAPGTGAQFSLIPPQNASGNWVKVVQRVPVRIQLDRQSGEPVLRAGMSAEVSIDTGRTRSLRDLIPG